MLKCELKASATFQERVTKVGTHVYTYKINGTGENVIKNRVISIERVCLSRNANQKRTTVIAQCSAPFRKNGKLIQMLPCRSANRP